jgi:hypothetical protein
MISSREISGQLPSPLRSSCGSPVESFGGLVCSVLLSAQSRSADLKGTHRGKLLVYDILYRERDILGRVIRGAGLLPSCQSSLGQLAGRELTGEGGGVWGFGLLSFSFLSDIVGTPMTVREHSRRTFPLEAREVREQRVGMVGKY